MTNPTRSDVLLSTQRALLGAITPLRLICVGWRGIKRFSILCYFDDDPQEYEVENLKVAVTEVLSDFPFRKVSVDFEVTRDELGDKELLDYVVYLRYEGEVF